MSSGGVKPIHTTIYLTLVKLKGILIELAIAHDTLVELGLREEGTKLRAIYDMLKEVVDDLEDFTNTEIIREEVLRVIGLTNKTGTPK